MSEDPSIDHPELSPPPESEGVDPPVGIPCRHLRNKGMFVYNSGAYGDSHEDSDNTIYWCVKTMKGFGPDDEMVSRYDCQNAERSCYEPF